VIAERRQGQLDPLLRLPGAGQLAAQLGLDLEDLGLSFHQLGLQDRPRRVIDRRRERVLGVGARVPALRPLIANASSSALSAMRPAAGHPAPLPIARLQR
jgi:hypothetical protein